MDFKKILIVEDDDAIRESAKEALVQGGYDVIEADNAFDGLDMFLSESPDLVISDYVLPGMSGESLFIQIRRNSDTPFMMVSGYSRGSHLENQKNYSYLAKPFDRKTLIGAVEQAINSKKVA